MWLATQHGFYSIVRKEDDLFFIRARVRQDLLNLLELTELDQEIREWATADYRYRIFVDFDTLLEVMVQLTARLDYPNFKGRVYEREDQAHKLGAYHRIWETMAQLQN
ncbi:MAG TPA: hypothetical protein VJ952_09745 [Opitutales bacterium]|nr:hypothetical protein [Opitutales bacterium]